VEADSGNKSSTLFLNWHNPVYGSSAFGILMQLRDLEVKSIWCCVELQCHILADSLLQELASLTNIKEAIATRACSADGCFSLVPLFALQGVNKYTV